MNTSRIGSENSHNETNTTLQCTGKQRRLTTLFPLKVDVNINTVMWYMFILDTYAFRAGPTCLSNFKCQCGPWAKKFAHPLYNILRCNMQASYSTVLWQHEKSFWIHSQAILIYAFWLFWVPVVLQATHWHQYSSRPKIFSTCCLVISIVTCMTGSAAR